MSIFLSPSAYFVNKLTSRKLIYSAVVLLLMGGCDFLGTGDIIRLDNGKLRLGFDRHTGALVEMKDLLDGIDMLETDSIGDLPWEIKFLKSGLWEGSGQADHFKFSVVSRSNRQVELNWKIAGDPEGGSVTVNVSLEENNSYSKWRIRIDGMPNENIREVIFPKITGLRDLGEEKLAVPYWMGQQMSNPRKFLAAIREGEKKFTWAYPGELSLQCLTLYNQETGGFYASCTDTLAFRKDFSVSLDTLGLMTFQISNFPSLDPSGSSYAPAYETLIGLNKGDWITAAITYRDWAEKQHWAKNSRFRNGLSPSWLDSTALWVWNRGRSDGVLEPAADLGLRTGLPVNVFWHWWHGCAYDVGFPEYFPPREGKRKFMEAVQKAKRKGIHSIVYMNVLQWGTSTESWKKENASVYAVKNIDGSLRSRVYNIFTGKSLTNMCIATSFWKDKYHSLAQKAVSEYGLNGIYMDQACLSRMCFDSNHSHLPGGGNYWVKNFGRLAEMIRESNDGSNLPVLAGEGGGEAWIPFLDAFLTLQVSKERYGGPGIWETIPMFQAVYHQYAVSYGNYSSLLSPPYDERWPEEYAPEHPLALLDEKYNEQFLMEQARSFAWGMQPAISNYLPFLATARKSEIDYLTRLAKVRQAGLKYLLYGKFLRSPGMDIPEKEIDISRLSIYAGRGRDNVTGFKGTYPQVYTGTWQADDGNIGIAIAGIGDEPLPLRFELQAEETGLPQSGTVNLIDADGRHFLTDYTDGIVKINYSLPPRGLNIIEITD